jgi:excisionase family DNA binding protein
VAEQLLTVTELSKRWNVSPSIIYALVQARQLGCVRIGLGRGTVRFTEEHVREYLMRQEKRKFKHLA